MYKVLGHKKAPAACAFAPSGRSFTSGDKDGLVFMWDCTGSGGGATATEPRVEGAARLSADVPPLSRQTKSSSSPLTSSRRATPQGKRTRPASAGAVSRTHGASASVQAKPGAFVPWTGTVASCSSSRRSSPPRRSTAPPLPPPASPPSSSLLADAAAAASAAATATRPAEPAVQDEKDGLDALPAPLSQTLRSMQGHLEIMARTVQLLERRLAMTEQQVFDMKKEMLQAQTASPPVSADLPPSRP